MNNLIIRFLKKIKELINADSTFILKVSFIFMLIIIILTFVTQYNNTMLEKKQKHIGKLIVQLENDIRVVTSDYVSLISPSNLKQLSDFYLPSFRNIKSSDKIRISEFR